MKNDYLWDKTGNDPEIENLENVLKAFRQNNPTPPELPAKVFVIEQKPKRYFQFAFAGFASLSLLIVAVGIFQFVKFDKSDSARVQKTNIKHQQKPVVSVQNKETPKISDKEKPLEPKIVKAKFTPKIKRNFVKTEPKIIGEKVLAKRFKTKPIKQNPKTVYLTQEEKDAYEQLMQALAITGSQMRIVREKIRGEEKDLSKKVEK